MTRTLKIKSCIDCPFHEVRTEGDPDDWFNDDDVKVVCKKKNYRENYRVVISSCRPYQMRIETTPPPQWCPLEDRE
jgi:hypothetical protein